MSELKSRVRRWLGPAALGGICALFLGLLAWFAPPSLLLSKQPVLNFDYALHAYQVQRALVAFRSAGALWGYDPLVLAGQPVGVVEDLTSKGTELFVIGMTALGFHPGFAFNLFILLAFLGMPAAGWASARLFGLSKVEAAVVVLLWVLMWFFDSFMHWCWAIGMITWSAACYLAVLYTAVLHRTLETREPRWFLALLLLGAALTLIHPVGSSRVDLQACKLEYSIVSPK